MTRTMRTAAAVPTGQNAKGDDEMTRSEFEKICEEYSKKDCEGCLMFYWCDENVDHGTGSGFDDDYECPGDDCYECPYCGDCSRTAGW